MSVLIGFLYVIEVVVCLLLALVVMLQKPKEGGLGGLAGQMGEAVFGADAGNVLIKATIWLGTIFLVNTLLLARLTSTIHSKSVMAGEKPAAPIQRQMPQLLTDIPPAPAPAPVAKPAAPAPAPAPVAKPPAAPTAKPAAPVAKPAAPAPKPVAKPAAPAPKPAASAAKPPAPVAKPPAPVAKPPAPVAKPAAPAAKPAAPAK